MRSKYVAHCTPCAVLHFPNFHLGGKGGAAFPLHILGLSKCAQYILFYPDLGCLIEAHWIVVYCSGRVAAFQGVGVAGSNFHVWQAECRGSGPFDGRRRWVKDEKDRKACDIVCDIACAWLQSKPSLPVFVRDYTYDRLWSVTLRRSGKLIPAELWQDPYLRSMPQSIANKRLHFRLESSEKYPAAANSRFHLGNNPLVLNFKEPRDRAGVFIFDSATGEIYTSVSEAARDTYIHRKQIYRMIDQGIRFKRASESIDSRTGGDSNADVHRRSSRASRRVT